MDVHSSCIMVRLLLMCMIIYNSQCTQEFEQYTYCLDTDSAFGRIQPIRCPVGQLLYISVSNIGSRYGTTECQWGLEEFDCTCHLNLVSCDLTRECNLSMVVNTHESSCLCNGTMHIFVQYRCLMERDAEIRTQFNNNIIRNSINSIMIMSNIQLEMTSVPTNLCKLTVQPGTEIKIEILHKYTNRECALKVEIVRSLQPAQRESFCSSKLPKYKNKDWKTKNLENVYIRAMEEDTRSFEARIWILVHAINQPVMIQCGINKHSPLVAPTLPPPPERTSSTRTTLGLRRPKVPPPTKPGKRPITTANTTVVTTTAAILEVADPASTVENKYNVVVGSIVGGAVLLGCLALYALTLLFINTLRKRNDSLCDGVEPPPAKSDLHYSRNTLDSTGAALPYTSFSEEGRLQFMEVDGNPEPQTTRYQKNTTTKKGNRRKFNQSGSAHSLSSSRVDHIVLPTKNPRHQYQGGLQRTHTPSISGSLAGSYHSQNSSHNSLHSSQHSSHHSSHPSSHNSSSHKTETTMLTSSSGSTPQELQMSWSAVRDNEVCDDLYESLEKYDRRAPSPAFRSSAPYHTTLTPNYVEEENYTPTLGGLAGIRGRMFSDRALPSVHQSQF